MALLSASRTKHRYQTCEDEDCDLPYCRIYKEGYGAGHGSGFGSGQAVGQAEGFAEGYAAGQADAGE